MSDCEYKYLSSAESRELKEAAWNVLHENPGMEYGDWVNALIAQYPSEVVDVLGPDPETVYAYLADYWESMTYEDPVTGICERFCDWAEYFVNERSVELYDLLAGAELKLARIKAVLGKS